jgi:hypothetical protein
MILGIVWGYRRDKRDEINYELIRNDKRKLYVGLFLDPIEPAYDPNQKDKQKLYATT